MQLEAQLNNMFPGEDFSLVEVKVDMAYKRCMETLSASRNKYLNADGTPKFSLYHSGCWSIFLYYLSNCLKYEEDDSAAKIYYLNKILHSIDWYYEIELPDHFMVEHPLGSVLGRAKYGDYLFVNQGVTIGGNVSLSDGELSYPILGERVTLFSDAKILGKCVIGNNVILSANSYIINENVPDNSIVFGSSPNLIIKEDAKKIDHYLKSIWRIENEKN